MAMWPFLEIHISAVQKCAKRLTSWWLGPVFMGLFIRPRSRSLSINGNPKKAVFSSLKRRFTSARSAQLGSHNALLSRSKNRYLFFWQLIEANPSNKEKCTI